MRRWSKQRELASFASWTEFSARRQELRRLILRAVGGHVRAKTRAALVTWLKFAKAVEEAQSTATMDELRRALEDTRVQLGNALEVRRWKHVEVTCLT
jgi:hypothetical protein